VAGDNGSILKTINGGEENSNSADWHIDENTEIVIFPNPARSNLTITGINQNSIISIYDMAGNLKLFQIIVDNQINIVQLIPGIYILRIIDHNKVVFRKIVRE
jgi:hypothetical protein